METIAAVSTHLPNASKKKKEKKHRVMEKWEPISDLAEKNDCGLFFALYLLVPFSVYSTIDPTIKINAGTLVFGGWGMAVKNRTNHLVPKGYTMFAGKVT
ncbi:hypothetical protein BC937DRAFT_91603 [Endogone sp. FLAS-F59071]|nr:hypothetical protein BC937DRAFT_91603 [Endogone sp. FLAS-F59071]|eukprot:RUS16113.1 hypothetical protein BC937DRAFT_91603 [Endogone sp. FLAS-F59071]